MHGVGRVAASVIRCLRWVQKDLVMFLQRTLLLILLSIATSHALSEDGTPSSVFDEAGPVLKISPIALHLAKYLPVADTSGELSSIAFQGDVDYEYLSSGWNPMETDDSGAGASWTKTRNAVVDFQLVARRNLTVRLKVAPPPKSESLPRQTLQVRWNGTEIDTFLLEWGVQEIQFQVPLSLQMVGPNRMELPLFQIFKLLHAFDDRKSQPIGRKQLVDNWRELNVQFGNV